MRTDEKLFLEKMESRDDTTLLDSSTSDVSRESSEHHFEKENNNDMSKTISREVISTAMVLSFTFILLTTVVFLILMDMYGWSILGSLLLLITVWLIFAYISPIIGCIIMVIAAFLFVYEYVKLVQIVGCRCCRDKRMISHSRSEDTSKSH